MTLLLSMQNLNKKLKLKLNRSDIYTRLRDGGIYQENIILFEPNTV